MNNVEVLFVDEKEIHIPNIMSVKNVGKKLYFFDCDNGSIKLDFKNFGKFYSGKYQKDIVEVNGYFEGMASIGSDVFLLGDDDRIYKINSKNEMINTNADYLTGQKNFYLSSLASDGKKLYVQNEKRNEILVVDKNLNLESRIKIVFDELYSGNNYCGIENDINFLMYKEGKLKSKRNIKALKHNSLREKENIFIEAANDEELDEFEINMHLSKLNYPLGKIIGNEGIYVLMSQGNLFYPTSNGGLDLGGDFAKGNESKVATAFNSKYTFFFNGERAQIFNGPKLVNENLLEVDISNIRDLTADNEFIYALTFGNILQRYKILK